MQLAILLSLIHKRGSSLPDKRTALYDSYIELFFDRESDKSVAVRDNRDILLQIHRYLAWQLHSRAESDGGSGTIATEELHRVLKSFLEHEGHKPELAAMIFSAMVERVVAIVSRVQGTYEFEVQPLREYFAARYLFETAPYSPPGGERRGTRPDRFDVLARNFYWLNVTRFYAGCYSKGELASLIERVRELIEDAEYHRLSHPRMLASMLLSDWVFAQHPKSVKEVVKIILDGIGLRFVLLTSDGRRMGSSSGLQLPQHCGNEELVDACFTELSTIPPHDFAIELGEAIQANAAPDRIVAEWMVRLKETTRRDVWLEYGVFLGAIGRATREELTSCVTVNDDPVVVAGVLLRARCFDVIEQGEASYQAAIDAIMSDSLANPAPTRGHTSTRSSQPTDTCSNVFGGFSH